MSEQRVLLETRSQRLATMIVGPMLLLPVGPVMRGVRGEAYDPLYGGAVAFAIVMIAGWVSGQWAVRHGGEWLVPAERLRRVSAEAAEMPRWPLAVAAMAMMALFQFGL